MTSPRSWSGMPMTAASATWSWGTRGWGAALGARCWGPPLEDERASLCGAGVVTLLWAGRGVAPGPVGGWEGPAGGGPPPQPVAGRLIVAGAQRPVDGRCRREI